MKHYYIIDDRTTSGGAMFEDMIDTQDRGEAIAIARVTWEKLSEHDRKHCDAFYVGYADELEEGVIDYDTLDVVETFK